MLVTLHVIEPEVSSNGQYLHLEFLQILRLGVIARHVVTDGVFGSVTDLLCVRSPVDDEDVTLWSNWVTSLVLCRKSLIFGCTKGLVDALVSAGVSLPEVRNLLTKGLVTGLISTLALTNRSLRF